MPELSIDKEARRLRIYISESDKWRGKPLDSELLSVLRAKGMAGATVFRGSAGFGAHSRIHSAHIEVLSYDLPVMIEVIDTPEKITSVIEIVYPMVREGLITVDEVQIIKYTHRFMNPLPSDRLVSEVMTRKVITLKPEMSIQQAWELMLKFRVKAPPVVDTSGRVIGILTDEDLLERAGIQQRLSVAIRMDAEEVNHELRGLKESRLTVKDVMTHPVTTAREDETLGAVTSRMVKTGLKRLPVVNEQGKLIGVISRLDVLRQVANITYETSPEAPPSVAVRTVADIMTTEIPMVSQDDDLSLIIEKFSRTDSHRLIVVDADGKIIGLISDSDVVTRVQPATRPGILSALRNIGKPPAGRETALDLMSAGPLTTTPDTPVVDALKAMLAEARKWMVVVDAEGHPLGLVDRQMMLTAIAVFDTQT